MSANNHPRMQVRQGISGGFRDRCRSAVSALCLGAGLVAAAGVAAQSVDLDPLLLQHDVTAMAEVDGHLFAGLDGGGVAVLPVDNLDGAVIWTAGADLSGNDVTDMAWTGENLWIATGGNGLTRVNDPAGSPAFRQFAINLGGLDLTAVTGGMIGGSERVYYAMDGAGIGQIVDGLSGNLYTAEQDDLISNTVNAMQIWEGQLFVGTPIGVSRFANNVFTDQNANWWSGRAIVIDGDSAYADIRGVKGTFTVTIHSVCANGSWAKYTRTIPKNGYVQWELNF